MSPRTPPRDIGKLPQWAQRHIATLEMRLKEARATLATGPEDSDTFADPYESAATRPLGAGTLVRFAFDGDQDSRNYIDVRLTDGALLVRGSESVRLFPQASNTFQVQLGRLDYR